MFKNLLHKNYLAVCKLVFNGMEQNISNFLKYEKYHNTDNF